MRATSRKELAEAVSAGVVVRDSRGRYALPSATDALRRAHAMSAVLSHQSAAAHWGWEQKDTPATITVTVPRNRRLRMIPKDVSVHWADLAPDDIDRAGVTSRSRTLVDCLRTLPFDAALTIADSALRNGDCGEPALVRLCHRVRGPGSGTARRVAACANGLAANPFESVLRALCLDAGLDAAPQVSIYREDGPRRQFLGRPDLVDRGRRLIFEADSYEYHGGQQEFRRDCRRYNGFQLVGFRCFRMPWLDTIREQHRVTDVLLQLVNPSPVPLTFLVAA